jgi:hypothetical protein
MLEGLGRQKLSFTTGLPACPAHPDKPLYAGKQAISRVDPSMRAAQRGFHQQD